MDDQQIRDAVAKVKNLEDLVVGVRVHEAAKLFPMLDKEDFVDFCIDIRDNGQSENVTYLDRALIDGRNRFAACVILKKTCLADRKTKKEIKNPFTWVLSKNIKRRHLTTQQRAMVAAAMVEAEKQWRAELTVAEDSKASERQFRSKIKGPSGSQKRKAITAREAEEAAKETKHEKEGRIRDHAANAANVSGRTVAKASIVITGGSKEVIDSVKNNQIGLELAKAVVATFPNKSHQNRLLKQGPVGIRAAIQREQAARMTKPGDPLRNEKLARNKAIKTLEAAMRAVDDYAALVPHSSHKPVIRAIQQTIKDLWPVKK